MDEPKEANAGLVGLIIVTRKGYAKEDATPKDVDNEIIVSFFIYDENASPLHSKNVQVVLGRSSRFDQSAFSESYRNFVETMPDVAYEF